MTKFRDWVRERPQWGVEERGEEPDVYLTLGGVDIAEVGIVTSDPDIQAGVMGLLIAAPALANLCAQLEEDARRRHDSIFAITSSKGHDCAANAEAGNPTCQALEAARELMEKYSAAHNKLEEAGG